MSPPVHTQPESILVYVGQDLLGDGLIKLPFVRALRAAFPEARVTWLAGTGKTVYGGSLAPLVAGLIDEVIEGADIPEGWWPAARPPLAGRRFDLVIDTQRRVRRTVALKRIRHGVFISGALGWLLSDRRPPLGTAKPVALAHQLLALVEAASGAIAQPGAAPLPESREDAAFARLALPDLADGRVYVGFAPGASVADKLWPLERFMALAADQARIGRVPVFLLGPMERDWATTVSGRLPSALLPLPEGASPMLTIAVSRRLAAAVANDSGAGHLIAAAGVPLVSLFGPTQAAKLAPLAPRMAVVRAQDFGGDAMVAIPVDAVARALDSLLSPAPPRP